MEILTALDDSGINRISKIINEIYDSDIIAKDLNSFICIALHKKPGADECDLQWTIRLMNDKEPFEQIGKNDCFGNI